MGFFDALKRFLTHESQPERDAETRKKIQDAWGLTDEAAEPEHPADAVSETAYDRKQWQRKLRKLLDDLPESRDHWQELIADAHALNFEDSWVADQQAEEFRFLMRRAVADRVISEDEHERIEMARRLMGISEEEAVKALQAIVAEAEAFFGKPIKDES